MLRTFKEHVVRPVASLDGLWEFVPGGTDRRDWTRPRRYTMSMLVPGAWETVPGLENHRGIGWYRRQFTTAADGAVRLVFGGVSHTGTVFVDGRKVGSHYDAFTPWEVVIPRLKQGCHELVVRVDNTFGKHSALHLENDYYTYGGITRPVELQRVPRVFIHNVHAVPRREGSGWVLDVSVWVRNLGRGHSARTVEIEIAGQTRNLGMASPTAKETAMLHATVKGLKVKPWTAEKPHLYELAVRLRDNGEVVDDRIDRVGFREIKVRGKRLLLNGTPLRLRGFNRHEDHPQFGCALPVEAMITDINLMKDMGCNFVRTCHYPNDMRFLDLCDETGMYVWEESHSRNTPFGNPNFKRQIIDSTTEMVDRHFNHPAIIIWASLNECDSKSSPGRKTHKYVLELLRKLDGSRPVTFASNKQKWDRCLDLVDIVSWNRYDAWYGGDVSNVEPRSREYVAWLHGKGTPKSTAVGKPIIMSEFGAGALYGNRQTCRSPWSEEYQADALDEYLRVYLHDPTIVGTAIWQFSDVRVTRNWRFPQRPRTMNNKGIVDEYRRPKLAYEVVRKRMNEAVRQT